MTTPYREPRLPAQKPEPPSRLVYSTEHHERHVGPLRAFAQKAIVGGVIGAVLAILGSPGFGLVVFVAGGAWGVWSWTRARDIIPTELIVENGSLLIAGSPAAPPVRIALRKLRDVRLDTKEIQRVQGDPRFALSALGSPILRVAPPVDVSRIVFDVGKRAAPIELTEAYVSYSECVEWVGRIRTFLRAHGWVPMDERKKPEKPRTREPPE
jgi:hypothetical protein